VIDFDRGLFHIHNLSGVNKNSKEKAARPTKTSCYTVEPPAPQYTMAEIPNFDENFEALLYSKSVKM
jgi:hypothetical protein